MKSLKIERTDEREFTVVSGVNHYHITYDGRYHCDCPARGTCKHLRTALGCNGLTIGAAVEIGANTDSSDDDGLLDPEEFDAEAGRDIAHELRYVRTGREKRNYGA